MFVMNYLAAAYQSEWHTGTKVSSVVYYKYRRTPKIGGPILQRYLGAVWQPG